ncbi:alkaline phosphatase [Bradymonas sediminis]|nr:alkaline phosphatase [Bradymonas sediminis]
MRMIKGKAALFLLLLGLVMVSSCSHPKTTVEPDGQQTPAKAQEASVEAKTEAAPKRIIYLIADGMGVSAASAATYAKGAPLSMLGMERMGLVTTHSYDFVTTDSAASATALAAGRKTHFEGMSVKPGTTVEQETDPAHQTPTMLEKAHAAGWKTGLVATVRVTHATPGAFAGHRVNRRQYDDLAADMLASGVDVVIGGGRRFFDKRKDGKDLMAAFKEKGYAVADTLGAMKEATPSARQMVALLDPSDFKEAGNPERQAGLTEMMQSAIEVLDRDNEVGFFLMVEGSQVDWRAHSLDGEGVVKEMLEFDETVQAALDYAAGRDDTLVVVTSDHETGGFSVLDSSQVKPLLAAAGGADAAKAEVGRAAEVEAKYPSPEHLPAVGIGEYGEGTPDFAGLGALSQVEDSEMRLSFGHLSLASRGVCAWKGRFSAAHTAAMVAVYAHGPGAQSIAASRDNAVLGARLMALVDAETVPVYASDEDAKQVEETAEKTPTNVILMVGGGMGVGAVTAGYYAKGSLAMMEMPVQGLVATHGADRLANDAAAAATALATGQRTHAGALGGVGQGDAWKSLPTLLERSEQAGMMTGLVTSGAITGATSAAFYAHTPNFSETPNIAHALSEMAERVEGSDGVDLVYTGEDAAFSNLPEMTARALENLARQAQDASKSDKNKGFFLMVEGAQIDAAQRGLKRDRGLVDAVVDFDGAVRAAVEFARADGETLVLVTGDRDYSTSVIDHHYGHNDCQGAALVDFGGTFELEKIAAAPEALGPACQPVEAVTVANADTVACEGDEALRARLQGEFAPLHFSLQYGWVAQVGVERAKGALNAPTSANFVPLFAFGPGASAFEGFHDQPALGQMLQQFVSAR